MRRRLNTTHYTVVHVKTQLKDSGDIFYHVLFLSNISRCAWYNYCSLKMLTNKSLCALGFLGDRLGFLAARSRFLFLISGTFANRVTTGSVIGIIDSLLLVWDPEHVSETTWGWCKCVLRDQKGIFRYHCSRSRQYNCHWGCGMGWTLRLVRPIRLCL